MARPQSPDYDTRRQLILDTAADLIAKEGFAGTSVNDIAAACDISKSLIYHYYSSKSDILFAAMEDYLADLCRLVTEAVNTDTTAEERFRAVVHALLQNYKFAGAKHRVLLQELNRLSGDQRQIIVAGEDAIVSQIAELIGGIAGLPADRKKTRPDKSKTAMTMLFMGMVNWTHTWFDPDGPIDADTLADMATDIFLRGVRG